MAGEAGKAEVWAARAWNVFNEGRPFSVVFPVLVLLVAAPLGLGPSGGLPAALAGAGAGGRGRGGRRPGPLCIPAPNQSALVARRGSVGPPARAVARAKAPGRSPG